MKHTNLKALLAATLVVSGLTACFDSSSSAPSSSNQGAALSIRVGVDPVNALKKSSTISLSKLIVVLTSSASDTLRDTITSSTSPSLSATSTTAQTISKNYTLNPLRTWKVVATTKDSRDSIIHRDSATTPVLYDADTVAVNLSLSSRFTMYQANFNSIPDSIASSASGTVKQVLHINRLVLKIDGNTMMDSSLTYFTGSPALNYDYVLTGSHTVQLLAYGPMYSWNTANPLYSGSTVINVAAGNDSTVPLTLNWVGPTTGTGSLSVTIGKVGKVTVNGGMSGTVITQ